jgi:hypothetical protein
MAAVVMSLVIMEAELTRLYARIILPDPARHVVMQPWLLEYVGVPTGKRMAILV